MLSKVELFRAKADMRWANAAKSNRDAVDAVNGALVQNSLVRVFGLQEAYEQALHHSAEALKAFKVADARLKEMEARSDEACARYRDLEAIWRASCKDLSEAFETWKEAVMISHADRSQEAFTRCDEADAWCDAEEVRCAEAKAEWDQAEQLRDDAIACVNRANEDWNETFWYKGELDANAHAVFSQLMEAQKAHENLIQHFEAPIRTCLAIDCAEADKMATE